VGVGGRAGTGAVGAGTGGGGTTGSAGGGGGALPPAGATWSVAGGDSLTGRASGGGVIHVVAQGAVTFGAVAPAAPAIVPTGDAVPVDAAALSADVTVAGSVRLDGTLVAGCSDPIRQITATGGDILVNGTLSGGDAGGGTRGLTLLAPNGTVYVNGT